MSSNQRRRRYEAMRKFRKKLQRWVLAWMVFWLTLLLVYQLIAWLGRLMV